MEIDKKIIKKLIETLDDLKKSLKDEDVFTSDSPVEEETQAAREVVKSPIVGTAYLASEPGAKPFVSVGKKIKKGDTGNDCRSNENNESCSCNFRWGY